MKESEKRTISIIIILALFIGAAIVFFYNDLADV